MYVYEQEYSTWCWAACAQMEGKYHTGSLRPQYSIVEYIMGNPHSLQMANISQIESACIFAAYNNLTFGSRYFYLSYADVKQKIDNYEPFIIFLSGYKPTSTSQACNHLVMGYGYLKKNGQD
ncbi:MAG: C39 family peptidase, partial [Erysipelotrichales bacterium]|nr:C39 family peptidase [Erysipelotrichales bacterium]